MIHLRHPGFGLLRAEPMSLHRPPNAARFRFGALFVAALLLLGGNAFADTYTIDATSVDWNRGENIWINENGNPVQTYFTGVIPITLTDTNTGQTWNRDTLCADLFVDIYIGQTYWTTVLSPAVVPGRNLPRAAWLVNNALRPAENTNYVSQLPRSDWVTNSTQGAGIQLAIWDIVEDGGDGLSAGKVQASTGTPTPSDVLYWATNYEALSLGKSSYSAYVYSNVDDTYGPVGGVAQMLLGPEFTDSGPATFFSIGNRVFNDNGAGGGTANNGINDGAEPGIANVVMDIYAADGSGNPTGSVLATTITDASGYYRFDGLPAGTYVVVVDVFGSGAALNGMVTSTGWNTNLTLAGDLRDHGKDAPLVVGSVLPGGIASVPVQVGIGLQPNGEATYGLGAGTNGPSGDASDNLVVDFGFHSPSPTAAVMAWLGAYVDTNGQVWVTWQTLSEDDLLYFDVLRSAPSSDEATDVTPGLVDAQGGQDSGHLYQVKDSPKLQLPGKYTYCLVGWNSDLTTNVLGYATVNLTTNNAGAIRITGIQAQASGMLVQWVGGKPPYTLETQTNPGGNWMPVGPAQPGETEAVVPANGSSGLFRVKGGGE
jgi:hypothetical protein